MRALLLGGLVALSALSGCSSDAVDPPEPSVDTPGAFVAQQQAPGDVRLLRTLAALSAENGELILFVTIFEPHAASFEQAGELARRRDLAVAQLIAPAVRSELEQLPLQVVWYRSLEAWETELVH